MYVIQMSAQAIQDLRELRSFDAARVLAEIKTLTSEALRAGKNPGRFTSVT